VQAPEDVTPAHSGQIELTLGLGDPFELDSAGSHNQGRGLFDLGVRYWFPARIGLGLWFRAGSMSVPDLLPVGVGWIHLEVAKGFLVGDNLLFNAGLLLGVYNNSFTTFPSVGLKAGLSYALLEHFFVGTLVHYDLAVGSYQSPMFASAELNLGFRFR
jgi:hypothetical protein